MKRADWLQQMHDEDKYKPSYIWAGIKVWWWTATLLLKNKIKTALGIPLESKQNEEEDEQIGCRFDQDEHITVHGLGCECVMDDNEEED